MNSRAVRRELLAALAVPEREPVNVVEACGVRYRVVRGDEFTRSADDGRLEPPRPSDMDKYGPMKLHPTMDEDGTLTYD